MAYERITGDFSFSPADKKHLDIMKDIVHQIFDEDGPSLGDVYGSTPDFGTIDFGYEKLAGDHEKNVKELGRLAKEAGITVNGSLYYYYTYTECRGAWSLRDNAYYDTSETEVYVSEADTDILIQALKERGFIVFKNDEDPKAAYSLLPELHKGTFYELFRREIVMEDIDAQAEGNPALKKLSDEDYETVVSKAADLYVSGRYDCNLSYWDNLDNVLEEAVYSLSAEA